MIYAQNQKPREHTHDVNEGMEALRQIATTSLFLQNEQHTSTKNSVPIIKEPDKPYGKHIINFARRYRTVWDVHTCGSEKVFYLAQSCFSYLTHHKI